MLLRWLGLGLTIATLAYATDTSVVSYMSAYQAVAVKCEVLEEAQRPSSVRHTVAPDRSEDMRNGRGYC